MDGDAGGKVWCKGTGGEKDRPEVDEDEGNGGEIKREGSLVDEGSSEEEEGSGSGFVGDKGLGEVGVKKRGQRNGLLGKRMMGVWKRVLD